MIKQFLTYIFLFFAVVGYADQVRFTMTAPNAVSTGDQFRLSFSINQQGDNLQLPNLNDFDILMGPSTSQSFSTQIINGKTTQSQTFSYTYILRAKKEGTFEFRPATISVDGKIYESNSLKVQVVKGQPQQQQQTQQNNNQSTAASLGKNDLFTTIELSKKNVYKSEQIIAVVKLYALPNLPLTGFEEVNLPTYEGFYTQDIDIPQQINFTREVYNGKIYQVGILKKTVLFPQQNGKITIEPFSITCQVRQQVRQRSFFDDFFDSYRTIKAKVTSQPLTVNVKDLPTAPANFYGGVGNFSITSSLSDSEISANDAVTLKIVINGSGNIRLVQNPNIELPPDFEKYDPKSTENVQATDNGTTGSKTVEYLFQPRYEGDYTIPAVQFAYFNPATSSFVTKSTQEFDLHVTKGADEQSTTVMSSLRKEDVRLIGQDIRFIKQNNTKLYQKNYTFFGSLGFYSIYGGSALAFLLIFIIYRKKARENANIALVRNKKANRIAKKRLREASAFMKQNKNEAFYESVLKSFWGYLSDKLSIPVAELNRESAVTSLGQREVGQSVIDEFVEIIEQCEFARFAPATGSEARHEIYKQAESVMSKMEKQIKR